MAIKSVYERVEEAEIDWTAPNTRVYTRVFFVECDSKRDSPLTACAAAGIPLHGAIFQFGNDLDATSRMKQKAATLVPNSSWVWRVVCKYEPNVKDSDLGDDPLARPWKKAWSTQPYEEAMEKDVDGKPLRNSAGEPFDPPPTTQKRVSVLNYSGNLREYDEGVASQWRDKLNSHSFLGAARGVAKIGDFAAEEQFESGLNYWAVVVTIEFKSGGWDKEVLDRGFYEIGAAGGGSGSSGSGSAPKAGRVGRRRILDENGQPIETPALLDGSGKRLADGADPVYLKFREFEFADFGALFPP